MRKVIALVLGFFLIGSMAVASTTIGTDGSWSISDTTNYVIRTADFTPIPHSHPSNYWARCVSGEHAIGGGGYAGGNTSGSDPGNGNFLLTASYPTYVADFDTGSGTNLPGWVISIARDPSDSNTGTYATVWVVCVSQG